MEDLKRDPVFEAILEDVERSRRIDLRCYKRSSLMRRLRQRMQIVGVSRLEAYRAYLAENSGEVNELFNTVLINVTRFFRDPWVWEYLATAQLPGLAAGRAGDGPIRAWCAGCASGEEVYTLAMLLAEVVGTDGYARRVRIYATDVDEHALEQARQGVYSARDLEPVPERLRERYFEPHNGQFVFNQELRRAMVFGRHDLCQNAPISRLDLLVCRNTLMYLTAEAQERVLGRLHFALNDSGLIVLGRAEMLLTHSNLFTPADLGSRVFQKVPRATGRDGRTVLPAALHPRTRGRQELESLRSLALESSPAAQVVLDDRARLALASARARSLLNLRGADLNRPLRELTHTGLPIAVVEQIEQACRHSRPFGWSGSLQRSDPAGLLRLELTPLRDELGVPRGASLVFERVGDVESFGRWSGYKPAHAGNGVLSQLRVAQS